MKHIALLSPSTGGHHDAYLQLYIGSLQRLGHRVTAFTTQQDTLDAWLAATYGPERAHVRTIGITYDKARPALGPLSTLAGKYDWVKAMAAAVTQAGIRPDLVFHMWLDNCLTPGLTAQLTDHVVPYAWSGLYFHPWYLRKPLAYQNLRRGFLASYAALQSKRCPAVAVLDEGIGGKLQELLGGKPVIAFPDIADDTSPSPSYGPAQAIRARAGGRCVVALLGALSRRKGTALLLQAAQQLPPDQFFFVFAGVLDIDSYTPEERRLVDATVAAPPENCYLGFGYIPDDGAFNALVAASDVVFAAYLDFPSSSNLLAKAALFGKPIVVTDGYCMGERVRTYGTGVTVTENDAQACAACPCRTPRRAAGGALRRVYGRPLVGAAGRGI